MKKNFEEVVLSQYNKYIEENSKELEKIAIKKKFREGNTGIKLKLMVKCIFRVFGLKFDMQLEAFKREENIRQSLEDMHVYTSLKYSSKYNVEDDGRLQTVLVDNTVNTVPEYTQTRNYEELIKEKKSYLALMVENLDIGGLEEVVKLLALEYRKRKIDLKIFCTRKGGKIAEELQKAGIEVVVFNGKKRVFEKYIFQNRPLLINSHYVVDFMDVITKYQIPVVDVIHNMYVFLPEHRLRKELQKVKVVSEYIAVSKAAADIFLNKVMEVDLDKIHVVGNVGRKFENAQIGRKEMRHIYNIPQDATVFLVAGTIDERKNQLGIVRAWNILKRLTNKKIALVLAGESSGKDYEKQLRSFIKEWKLEDSVYMIGYCEKIHDLMEASDVLIVNSYYEGWSMAATEALYSGLPLIHSNCGSGTELVADGKNGILISNPLKDIGKYTAEDLQMCMRSGRCENIQELVVAMLKMIQDDECIYNKKDIKSFAKEKYTVNEMINAYLEVYCKACRI